MYCVNCGKRILPEDRLASGLGCIHCRGKKPAWVPLDIQVKKYERSLIIDALEKHNGIVAHAAKELGITRTGLIYKIGKHEINGEDVEIVYKKDDRAKNLFMSGRTTHGNDEAREKVHGLETEGA